MRNELDCVEISVNAGKIKVRQTLHKYYSSIEDLLYDDEVTIIKQLI